MYKGKELKVKCGDVYFLKDTAHVRNELEYFSKERREYIHHHVL